MANTTFYNRGDAYHDSAGNPAIIKRGNELTFTEHFNAGGGSELSPATAETLGGVKVGNGLNVTSDGTLNVAGVDYSTTEHLTGRKWIDGKDIYEKVVVLDSVITVTTNWTNLELSNADYDAMIHANGLHEDGSFYPLILDLHNSAQATTLYAKASASIDVKTLVFEYTKPTPAEPVEPSNTRTVKKTVKKG